MGKVRVRNINIEGLGMKESMELEHMDENVTDTEHEVKTNGLLTVADVAQILKVHINTVRNWSNIGVLKSFRIGPRGDRRFLKEDVYKFLKE